MATRFAQTRFVNGLNLGPTAKADGLLPIPLMRGAGQGWKCYYEDFLTGDDLSTNQAGWNVSVETTGTIGYAAGGLKLQPKDSTDNSSVIYQWDTASLLLDNSKKFYFEAGVRVDLESGGAMAQQEFFVGFTSDQATSNFIATAGTSWAFDDGFGWGQFDGDSTIHGVFRQSDVQQKITTTAALQDGIFTRLGIYYDGTNYYMYQDGLQVGNATQTVFNNDAAMGVTLYIKNGEAKTHDLTVGYIALAEEL